ncbi:outer membrane lipoprotein chaperone LolA [Muribacter muris]|uniref:Outer-membrane lipoprotein carrier protein n=1 Tax=Muribacter muris TaxID=67855 RepID=A0A4Y9K3W1_9PAST|nr:outer membrane lipoprotein chaperone LolA [Muribacter muris]MBF0784439.1 outer membrane lipoprotein chaperone LolA [Muribacter muris]MBF0827985.1 outer membrane lipoprotein chaperone LolA [Muribacter muris]TFV12212.1 outer membrane lipoprotein chaperone LolA [Muribacter muris]
MKKMMKTALVGLALFSLSALSLADSASVAELQKRLEQATQYSADFDQTVRSSKGKEIQKGKGKFYVKRPNLFRMDTKSPQENLIVSDGQTLWFYDPFVSQVTANWMKDAVSNTPFVLLTSNDKNHWDQYDVTQNMDNFVLKPKSKKSAIKQFDVRIDANGLLKGFSTIERDGQSNLYVLRNISTANVAADLFKFSVPKGAELDDQRNKKAKK